LAQEVFIGKVLKVNRPGWTLGVAEAVSFTKNGIHHSFIALAGLAKLDGIIGTG
jgi:hypothetical protein